MKLILPYPPSVNHYFVERVVGKRVMKFIGQRGKDFRRDTALLAAVAMQIYPKFDANVPLEIFMLVNAPDRRKRDINNLWKCVEDALQHAGVFPDDNMIRYSSATWDESWIKGEWKPNIIKGGQIEVVINALL